MAVKKDKKRQRGVSQAKCETSGRIVLVGTYKGDQLTDWRGWYNYPLTSVKCKVESVKSEDGRARSPSAPQLPADYSCINELWLFKGTKDERRYKAEFVGIKTREELIRDYGYPAKGKAHGTAAIDVGTIFREALKVGAEEIIVAHNHPSGDPTPSKADMQLTTTLQSAARLLGLKFLDHLILGSPDCEEGRGYVSVIECLG